MGEITIDHMRKDGSTVPATALLPKAGKKWAKDIDFANAADVQEGLILAVTCWAKTTSSSQLS